MATAKKAPAKVQAGVPADSDGLNGLIAQAAQAEAVLRAESGSNLQWIKILDPSSNELVPEDAVLGVLTEFFRKDKHFYCTDEKYIRYAERRLKTYKVRKFFVKIKMFFLNILRKIKRIFVKKKDEEQN
jgi:hypothetical protein